VDVTRRAEFTPRLGRGWFVVFAPGKARAGQSDAGVALAAGGDSDMGTAAAHGHTYAGQRQVEMYTWQHFQSSLKTEAHLLHVTANARFAQPLAGSPQRTNGRTVNRGSD